MGESKRRKARVYDLREIPLSGDDGAQMLIGSVLANLAQALDAAICLKEPGDGLLAWPLDSIVGQTTRLESARECPVEFDIRATPTGAWEFLIPEKLLVSAYCIDAQKRGIAFPGPIQPDEFLDRVRGFFRTSNSRGWVTVLPDKWKRAITSREGALQ